MRKPKLILKNQSVVDHVQTGLKVKAYREAHGVSQSCVASHIGQNYLTIISNLESGKRVWNPAKLDLVVSAIDNCSKEFPDHKPTGKNRKQKHEHSAAN